MDLAGHDIDRERHVDRIHVAKGADLDLVGLVAVEPGAGDVEVLELDGHRFGGGGKAAGGGPEGRIGASERSALAANTSRPR